MTLIILLNIAAILDCLDTTSDAPDEWSALDELCFSASDDDTDPREWTGVA